MTAAIERDQRVGERHHAAGGVREAGCGKEKRNGQRRKGKAAVQHWASIRVANSFDMVVPVGSLKKASVSDDLFSAITSSGSGRTTFVVANRLSLLRRADVILVLEKGRLLHVGTHDELAHVPGTGGAQLLVRGDDENNAGGAFETRR